MPPVFSQLRSRSTIHFPKVVDYTAVSPSEIMSDSIPDAARMQPFLVVVISLVAFVIMLMVAMLFSFWQLRRQQRLLARSSAPPVPTKAGSLYYRRALRKQPTKRVRWQSVVFHDSSPDSPTSATHLLLNDERFRPIKTKGRSMYGSASTKRQIVDTPPPYTIRDLSRFPTTPYKDMPATATTIDSQPMSEVFSPPPVPKKSVRRPAPLTLIVISPVGSKHASSTQMFKREPTPYPLAGQLTPAEDESASSYKCDESLSAVTVRPKLRLKTGDSLAPLNTRRSLRILPAQ